MYKTVFALILSALLLCGCAGNALSPQEVTSAPQTAVAPETTSPEDGEALAEELRRQTEQYAPTAVYRDLYIENQYLFLTESQAVLLILVPGYTQATAMPLGEITRIEQNEFSAFTTLVLYDKTNAAMSIMLSPEDAAAVYAAVTEAQG